MNRAALALAALLALAGCREREAPPLPPAATPLPAKKVLAEIPVTVPCPSSSC